MSGTVISNESSSGRLAGPRRLRRLSLALVSVGVLLLGVAQAQRSVHVTLHEGALSATAPMTASGYQPLDLVNHSATDAVFSVYRLKGDTSIAEFKEATLALARASASNGDTQAATLALADSATALGGVSVSKHSSKSMIVNLETGSYAVVAAPKDGSDVTVTTFRVSHMGPDAAPAPQVLNRVDFSDFAFSFPKDISTGENLWRVSNTGSQPHVADMYRLRPGQTVADLLAYLEGGSNGRAPYDKTASIAMVAEGETVFVPVDLAAGEWVALCFVPNTDQPNLTHVMEGMIAEFRVF